MSDRPVPSGRPRPDRITEEFLSKRGFPRNQDCRSDRDSFAVVGTSVEKPDAWEKVTGAARFAADLRLPRMLYGRLLRSPHPHARIVGIDLAAAQAVEGVVGIVTGADFPDITFGIIPWTRDEHPLCRDRVRHVGDPVAAVAATSARAAAAALRAIRVEYEPLLPVCDMADARRGEAPPLHGKSHVGKEVQLEFGNVEECWSRAERTVSGKYRYAPNTHAAIETHAVLASWSPQRLLTVWSSTQTPHYLHRDLARLLGLQPHEVRVIKPHVGGGFGGKSEPFSLEFCAALLAMRCGRPVRIVHDREEVFLTHRGRHEMEMDLRLAELPGGSLALDFRAELDGGAYSSYGMVTTYYSGALTAGIYRVESYRLDSRRWFTSKPAAGPKRGHGAVQPRFAVECALDCLAEQRGEDPIALRRRLFSGADIVTINDLRVGSSGLLRCLELAAERSDWHRKFRKLPYGHGIGVAASFYISGTNYPILADLLPQSGIQLKADRSGLVTVFTGAADIGQGSDSVLRQIVAEELGIDVAFIRVVAADSDLCPVDLGSYSSRVTLMAGNAAISAARSLRKQILGAFAERNGLRLDRVALSGSAARSLDDAVQPCPWVDAVRDAESLLGSLGSTGSYTTPNRGGNYRGALVGPSPAYSFTVHIAEVRVDPETGELRVERVTAAHDCGRALNPTQVEGQIEGSVCMGIGEALFEELRYEDALLLNGDLLDYKIPTILDVPDIDALVVEAPDPEGPFGAKEAGEGPLHPCVPAIANAIHDAVGIRLHETPFLPEVVLRAIQSRERAGGWKRPAVGPP